MDSLAKHIRQRIARLTNTAQTSFLCCFVVFFPHDNGYTLYDWHWDIPLVLPLHVDSESGLAGLNHGGFGPSWGIS